MKRASFIIPVSLVICPAIFAVPITLFMDTDTYLERAKVILVAQCTSIPAKGPTWDGLQVAEVNILKVLKGEGKPGPYRIVTIYPMKPQTTYMLYSVGGSALGTDLLALPELSVIPLPQTFKIADLEHKALKEQVQCMFSLRLFEVERQLAPLLEEKNLLEKAVSDRRYEWFESNAPLRITPVVEVSTHTDRTHQIWLDLDGKKLQWSHSSPGKSGHFYFQKMDASGSPYWEFSPCDKARIEDVVGKPLRTRFYGMYTPGRGDTSLGRNSLQSIHVRVGQALFARTVDAPDKIFVIQIEAQRQDEERMSAKYATICN